MSGQETSNTVMFLPSEGPQYCCDPYTGAPTWALSYARQVLYH